MQRVAAMTTMSGDATTRRRSDHRGRRSDHRGGAATTRPARDTEGDGSATTTAAAAADCPAKEPIETVTIGLVTDVGKVDDKSFNQSAWEGAQAAAEETGGTADFIETAAATDYATNIGQFVESGANVIITVGFALGEATAAAATANPDITFIGVDQFQADDGLQPDRPPLPRGPGRLPRRRPRRPAHRVEHARRRARHRPGPAGRRLQGGLGGRRRCTPTPRST